MACDKEILVLISAYADGESTREETARAELHLAGCAKCRSLVKEWQGQRQMLEWAYTLELSEKPSAADLERMAGENKQMSQTEKNSRLRLRLTPDWNWARLGAIAALLVITFAVYHYISTPPMMRVGTRMASGNRSTIARVDRDIQLKLGPDTIAQRIDSSTIRLEKGWISASVKHGSNFRILTNRMEVLDRGTIFQVGTGPRFDYVIVKEGQVLVAQGGAQRQVNAGQILISQEKGGPVVASVPKVEPETKSTPNGPEKESDFVPTDLRALDWKEKSDKLAERFPGVRMSEESGGGTLCQGGVETWYYRSTGKDFDRRFSEHFQDVAQVMAGGRIEGGNWEIPFGVILTHDLESVPGLSGDIFYVRLVPKDGTIVWRFSGLDGSQADIPFATGKYDNYSGHSGYSTGQVVDISTTSLDNGAKTNLMFKISTWPGELKPILSLTMGSTPMSESHKDEYAMLNTLSREVRKPLSDFKNMKGNSTLLYLDRERKHRILIAWCDTGRELCRLNDLIRQGRGGSATLGAISTDMPLSEPNIGPGIYLLRIVTPDASQSPHFEITMPDMRYVSEWNGRSFALTNGQPKEPCAVKGSWALTLQAPYRRNNSNVQLGYETSSARRGGFPFGFNVTGRPDGKIAWDKTWAKGWIRVRKP
jgi:predicted anti-sigma-YlaC factor YlaD